MDCIFFSHDGDKIEVTRCLDDNNDVSIKVLLARDAFSGTTCGGRTIERYASERINIWLPPEQAQKLAGALQDALSSVHEAPLEAVEL